MKPKPRIVCAAIKYEKYVIAGARHFDMIMHNAIEILRATNWVNDKIIWEQGFIDQFGKFYNRVDALKIVKESGQPFNQERNGHGNADKLFSEGLY